jgi:hypothetical protein
MLPEAEASQDYATERLELLLIFRREARRRVDCGSSITAGINRSPHGRYRKVCRLQQHKPYAKPPFANCPSSVAKFLCQALASSLRIVRIDYCKGVT